MTEAIKAFERSILSEQRKWNAFIADSAWTIITGLHETTVPTNGAKLSSHDKK
jgi:hypothetical protein